MNDATQFFNTTVGGGYEIERSLRFNSADSAYLNRTPSVAGNRKTWTWAGWVKRSNLGEMQQIWYAQTPGSPQVTDYIRFESDDTLSVINYNNTEAVYNWQLSTSAKFRDPSSWYHMVFSIDTTQATASNRVKIYINGAEVTDFATSNYPSQNYDTNTNNTVPHVIGNYFFTSDFYSGYLADIHFIDGQALDPTSFGDFSNGVWQPIAYAGTYGTNGFHLDFSDNSTAAALGTDTSGNSNTWTVNNISVTAGVDNDSLVDSPTNYGTDTGAGGEVRGNYATLNPLIGYNDDKPNIENGNLDLSSPANADTYTALSTLGVTNGKWYFEWEGGTNGDDIFIGIALPGDVTDRAGIDSSYGTGYVWRIRTRGGGYYGFWVNGSRTIYSNGVSSPSDIFGCAFDLDVGSIEFFKNGVSQGVASSSIPLGNRYFAVVGDATTSVTANGSVNFGQRPFAYTAPSGYKALCTANLPEPTIANGSTAMDVALYTGNGSTQTISGLNFSPDLVWIKNRSNARNHGLYDTVRGATNRLISNATSAETVTSGVTSFTSDGFVLGSNNNENGLNEGIVAWTWDAGDTTVTNNDGTTTSQVRANPSAGFSVVTYTGTGSLATIGHGLNAAPELIIVKSRSNSENWAVYSKAAGASQRLILNLTVSADSGNEYWNSTDPTSSVFTVNTVGQANGSGQNYVAYCFAPVDGYSSFGGYTGNGITDGTFVYTGFRPRWVMIKNASASGTSWVLHDTERDPDNIVNHTLLADSSGAEGTPDRLDILSNGFKIRSTAASYNGSTNTLVYACFAESPFATARAR